MATSIMIRVGISQREWQQLRRLSRTSGVPVTRLVADAIRESLLRKEQAA